MNIGLSNFVERLPEVQSAIASASFVAVDLELSGLSSSSARLSPMDTLRQRYSILRPSAEQLAITQLGVCTFHSEADGSLAVRPFNFYCFPRKFGRSEPRFLVQASSFSFLNRCGFDFNAWVSEGVSFLRDDIAAAEESAMHEEDSKAEAMAGQRRDAIDVTTLKATDTDVLTQVMAEVKTIRDLGKVGNEVVLGPMNGYMRRLVYQEVGAAFDDVLVTSVETDSTHYLKRLRVVFHGSPAAVAVASAAEFERKRRLKRGELQAAVGLTTVLRAISASKAPVIVHNGLLDVAHLASKFFFELPDDVGAFCKAWSDCVEVTIDTKHVLCTQQRQNEEFGRQVTSTVLGDAFLATAEAQVLQATNPVVAFPATGAFDRYGTIDNICAGGTSQFAHEAAYDALMTGILLARMATFLSPECASPAEAIKLLNQRPDLANQLYLMRVEPGRVLHLANAEANREPERPLTLHLSNFPLRTRTSDFITAINSLLEAPQDGSASGDAQAESGKVMALSKRPILSWKDSNTAFLRLHSQQNYNAVLSAGIAARAAVGLAGCRSDDFADGNKLQLCDFDLQPWQAYLDATQAAARDSVTGSGVKRKRGADDDGT